MANAAKELGAYMAQLHGEREAHQRHIAVKNAELEIVMASRDRYREALERIADGKSPLASQPGTVAWMRELARSALADHGEAK